MEDQSLASHIGDSNKMADRFLPRRDPPSVPPSDSSDTVSPLSSTPSTMTPRPAPSPQQPQRIPRKPLSKTSTSSTLSKASEKKSFFRFGKTTTSSTLQSTASEKRSLLQLQDDTIYTPSHVDDGRPPWRPFYLRRRALLIFGAIFVSIAVAIQALLAVSTKRRGLADANDDLSAVYRFGPSGVFILLSAFWARVEYQAQVYTPWIALSRGPTRASDSLLLDYLADLSPVVIYRSLRRKHFLVAAACTIGLSLKAMIALSAALLSPENVLISHEGVALVMVDEFDGSNPTPPETLGINTDPWQASNMAYGISNLNQSFPWGSARGHAFQRFSTDGEGFDTSTPSGMREVRAVVEGLVSEVSCKPARVTKKDVRRLDDEDEEPIVPFAMFEFEFLVEIEDDDSCRLTCTRWSPAPPYQEGNNYRFIVGDLSSDSSHCSFETPECEAAYATTPTGAGHAALLGNAPLDWMPKEDVSDVTIIQRNVTEGVVCTPRTWLTALPVTRRRDSFDVGSPVDPDDRRQEIDFLPLWGVDVNSSAAMPSASGLKCLEWPRPGAGSGSAWLHDHYNTTKALTQTIRDFADIYVPLYAHFYGFKTTQARSEREGSTTVDTLRLVPNGVIAYIATGLLGAAAIFIALLVCLDATPRRSFMPQGASTVAGYALLLRGSTNLLARLRGTASQPVSALRDMLGGNYLSTTVKYGRDTSRFEIINCDDGNDDNNSESGNTPREPLTKGQQPAPDKSKPHPPYNPWLTRPGYRIACLLILAGLIAAVRVIQAHSSENNGLVNIPDEDGTPYIYYTWSVVPSLIAVLLSNYLLARDLVVRAHAPLAQLLQGGRSAVGALRVAYVDNVGHRTLLGSLRRRDWAVLVSFLIPFPAAFLTAFTSTLFELEDVARARDVAVRQSTWLREGGIGQGLTAETILYHNASFPQWTYRDLVMSSVGLAEGTPPPARAEGEDVYVAANVSAVTTELACDRFALAELNSTVKERPHGDDITIFFPEGLAEGCGIEVALQPAQYFGHLETYIEDFKDPACGGYEFAFGWGEADADATASIMTGLWCKESTLDVVAEVRFVLPGWTIDQDHPPVIMQRNGPSEVSVHGAVEPGPGPVLPNGNALDFFFQALTLSRWAIPVEYLGDPDRVDEVEKAAVDLHLLIKAAWIDGRHTRVPFGNATDPDEPARPAAVTAVAGGFQRRLVANHWSAAFLTGMLSLILALDLVAFFITPRNALPKSPNSIAAMASYLADDIMARTEREAESPGAWHGRGARGLAGTGQGMGQGAHL